MHGFKILTSKWSCVIKNGLGCQWSLKRKRCVQFIDINIFDNILKPVISFFWKRESLLQSYSVGKKTREKLFKDEISFHVSEFRGSQLSLRMHGKAWASKSASPKKEKDQNNIWIKKSPALLLVSTEFLTVLYLDGVLKVSQFSKRE